MESKREQIVNFIQQHFISDNITSEAGFINIANELQKTFVHNHNGQKGGRDQAYNVLAMAIICGADGFHKQRLTGIDILKSGLTFSKKQ
ncbi:MAG: hypothetical protein WBE68_26520 [Candidatus Nitrosopolaris sp.]